MYTVLSYIRPFEGNREADVAPSENEFDTPAIIHMSLANLDLTQFVKNREKFFCFCSCFFFFFYVIMNIFCLKSSFPIPSCQTLALDTGPKAFFYSLDLLLFFPLFLADAI